MLKQSDPARVGLFLTEGNTVSARSKVMLSGLTAGIVMALAVGGASANRLSLGTPGWEVKWSGFEFIVAGSTVRCPVTLQGSFHSRTIAKTAGLLIGHMTRASVKGSNAVGACTGGTMTLLTATLPWHVAYEFLVGALPNIQGLGFSLIGLSVQGGSLSCLARTTETEPVHVTVSLSGGRATELTVDPWSEIALTGPGGFCAFGGQGALGGTSRPLTRLNSTSTITITLI
jgi:hypothetical protein